MAQWDELNDDDRAWAMAVDVADTEHAAKKCPACGGDPDECQNPDNQHAFEVTLRRCFKSRAVQEALTARKKDPHASSLVVTVKLNADKKKSARKK